MRKEEGSRVKVGKRAGELGLFANLGLALMKLVVGFFSGSMSVVADGMNNVSDAASSAVTLFGFKFAGKPADREHPYGHARSEYLAGLFISVMIIFIGLQLLKASFMKIFEPASTKFTLTGLLVLLASILAKILLSLYYLRTGKRIGSKTLIATGEDSRNDVLATTAVLAGGLIEYYSNFRVDGYLGMLVSLFILLSGIRLAKETVSPILGEGAGTELRKELTAFVEAHEKVLGSHDLMVHDYGPDKCFASIHIEMDSRNEVLESHEMIDKIEREVKKKFGIDLVIHHDPVVIGDRDLDEARRIVETLVSMRDRRISIHDFRMRRAEKESLLTFDMVLPEEIYEEADTIKESLEGALLKTFGKKFRTRITFDLDMNEY